MNNILKRLAATDLGSNVYQLFEKTSNIKNGTLIDLGVRRGTSSQIMLLDSEMNNNKVFGVDVDFSSLPTSIKNHKNYNVLLGDSVTIGKYWTLPIHGLFVDTFHIKEQVMMELFYWYPHLVEGGFIAFHDSHWPDGKHDRHGGIKWDRVETGIKEFFNISDLVYEDEFIKSEHYPESWGMTIVTIKKKYHYIDQYKHWDSIISTRNHLISLFWNETNIKNIKIDLAI